MANKPLVLTVDATVDPLKKAMRDGKAVLADYGASADDIMRGIQQAWQQGTGNVEQSVKAMQRTFDQQVRAMQSSARAAIAQGESFNPLGGMDSAQSSAMAQSYEQAATAARARAVAVRNVLEAEIAAGVVDEQRINTMKALLAASETAAQSFDRQADTLQRQAAIFGAVEAEMASVTAAQNRVTASAGAQRAGMQQLSFQIADVASGLAMIPTASNPAAMGMQVFAQQGSQVVQALALMKGEATGLIGFLAGPWGAAIIGGITVLGMLGAKMLDTGKDAKKAEADFLDLSGSFDSIAKNADIATQAIERMRKSLAQPSDASQAATAAIASKATAQAQIKQIDQQIADAKSEPMGMNPAGAALRAAYIARLESKRADAQAAITAADANLEAIGSFKTVADMQDVNRERLNARPKRGDRSRGGGAGRAGRTEMPIGWEQLDSLEREDGREYAIEQNVLGMQHQLLGAQMSLATSASERIGLAKQMLFNEERQALLANDAAWVSGKITDTEKELRDQDTRELFEKKKRLLEKQNRTPLQVLSDQFTERDGAKDAEQLIVDEFNHYRDAMRAGVQKLTGTNDPLINGLIMHLLDSLLFEPIAKALAAAKGAGGGGFFGTLLGAILPGFANGTDYAPGGPAIVGERGPELVNLPRGAQVIPNHRLAYPAIPNTAGGNTTIVQQHFTVDARGAVLAAQLVGEMQRIGAAVLAAAPDLTRAELADDSMQRLPS